MLTHNFTPEFALDMIQSYKGNLIQKYVSDHRINSALQEFLAAETSFVRQIIKTTTDISTAIFDDALTETNKTIKKIYQ